MPENAFLPGILLDFGVDFRERCVSFLRIRQIKQWEKFYEGQDLSRSFTCSVPDCCGLSKVNVESGMQWFNAYHLPFPLILFASKFTRLCNVKTPCTHRNMNHPRMWNWEIGMNVILMASGRFQWIYRKRLGKGRDEKYMCDPPSRNEFYVAFWSFF